MIVFVLFVYNDADDLEGNTIAMVNSCEQWPAKNNYFYFPFARTKVGILTYNLKLLKISQNIYESSGNIESTIHELIHLLGFNSNLF